MLPYNSEVVQNFNTEALNTSTKLTQARAYNQNAAIDYARQYALNPNHGPYHYFGIRGDCTNFTSQILEAAGVAQEVYGMVAQKRMDRLAFSFKFLGRC